MNNCLCCHQEHAGASPHHPKCLERLFGVPWAPRIPFPVSELPMRVAEAIGQMSISGVQIKAPVKLNKAAKELEVAHGSGTHILKPEPNDYPEVPQNENVCMAMAEDLELDVPPHGLFAMGDGRPAYVVRRFDRLPDGGKLHKEDMAQLLGYPTESKYKGSMEAVGKAIKRHASNPFLDLLSFYERTVFSFLIGNGDMHLKNWAVLIQGQEVRIAPCYDLVSSALYFPSEEESALTINGKRNKLEKADFTALAGTLGIEPKAAANALERLLGHKARMLEMVSSCALSAERKKRLKEIIQARHGRLAGR